MALGLELPEDTLTKLHEFQAPGESSGEILVLLFQSPTLNVPQSGS